MITKERALWILCHDINVAYFTAEEREAFDMAVNALSAMGDIQGVIKDMKVILHMDGEVEE